MLGFFKGGGDELGGRGKRGRGRGRLRKGVEIKRKGKGGRKGGKRIMSEERGMLCQEWNLDQSWGFSWIS